ncbi:MAG TPA: hypothetical protein VGH98_20880 [Gemmatimonadaceae bacterium]|jgi:hypothetical protein
MPSCRSLPSLAVLVLLAACGPVRPRLAAVAPSPEIILDFATAPAIARDQLVTAFAEHGLPVATSQPGVVEFYGPREKGILGYYDVFARAVIVPAKGGTHVTLFGEETHYPNASAREGTPVRIGPSSRGRALAVWTNLQAVAAAMKGNAAVSSHVNSQ